MTVDKVLLRKEQKSIQRLELKLTKVAKVLILYKRCRYVG